MARCARGCAQTNAWISVVFLSDPTKFGVNIAEWLLLNANVFDFK